MLGTQGVHPCHSRPRASVLTASGDERGTAWRGGATSPRPAQPVLPQVTFAVPLQDRHGATSVLRGAQPVGQQGHTGDPKNPAAPAGGTSWSPRFTTWQEEPALTEPATLALTRGGPRLHSLPLSEPGLAGAWESNLKGRVLRGSPRQEVATVNKTTSVSRGTDAESRNGALPHPPTGTRSVHVGAQRGQSSALRASSQAGHSGPL